MSTTPRKKLIEVSIPLEAINAASAREKSIRHGHPSTLHLWWARRPLAACRAVLFAQLVDDPSSWPDRFPTPEAVEAERRRLHHVIERLVPWEASNNEEVLNAARWEIARSVAWGLGEEPPAKEDGAAILAYLQAKAPPVYDPFSGGGSIPLEAQRLGLRAYGSDLNPVAVLIGKALVEIPPKFAGLPPVNPAARAERARGGRWQGRGAQGLAEDVRYYGAWMREEAARRIGHLYPEATLPDGSKATVIAWLWARTVRSPDPAAKGAMVPLASSFLLSSKEGSKAWVEPILDAAAPDGWRFEVRTGRLGKAEEDRAKSGTKTGRSGFVCLLTGAAIPFEYVRREATSFGLAMRLMAVVADGGRKRIYLSPTDEQVQAASSANAAWGPDELVTTPSHDVDRLPMYGMPRWRDAFTQRQLTSLTTLTDLLTEVRERILTDAVGSGLSTDPRGLAQSGVGVTAYADAVGTYLAFGVTKFADNASSICSWHSGAAHQKIRATFSRQALQMTWDFAEGNTFSNSTGNFMRQIDLLTEALERVEPVGEAGIVTADASRNSFPVRPALFSTDPPYYDNIGYADLSDFFYVWLRSALSGVWPDLFRRLTTPKDRELVATPYRHGGRDQAEAFFMQGMGEALAAIQKASVEDAPLAIYYAFKQSEAAEDGVTSAGWASFLQAVVDAGLAVDGTWPVRTELANRMIGSGTNALASSIVLVCRKRDAHAAVATRAEFVRALKREMPDAIAAIRKAGVGPVDMQQSVIGPGMASRATGASPDEALDAYGLLKTMIDNWRDAFDEAFSRNDKHKARNFASMALEARNAASHLAIPMADDEALRYLDAIHQLLRLVKAPEAEVAEAKKLYEAQRHVGVAAAPAAPQPTPAPQRLELQAADGPAKALKPWIEVALPHPDVIANRFKEAEFAADLFAVDAGHATDGYATPADFFGITFLTEGLKRVLTSALQRLSGAGGDPVIGLQTAFGGGKTHTMLAIYHLAKHLREGGDPSALGGMAPLVEKLGITAWPKPRVAVFVGSSKGADVSLTLGGGPPVRTLWGYIAWRLAGEAGLNLVAEAEAARTNPGSELLVALFKLAGPSVILLDELTMFARQLDDDRFEAFLSFIQSLTEAAKMVPGILIVGSLPESRAEAGGPRGVEALLRLEKVFGRVQSAWLPASGNETYEIVRRRLFQPLDADGERAREETIKAFHDLYKKNPAEFPPEAKEPRYLELLRLSYPIHPELFERLAKDWSSLQKFQRTRDVIRFMANVVGVLWHGQTRDPLITPARVPVAHEKVRTGVLYPLDPAFGSVVDKEVDGDGALPARMEANPSRRISQLRAATRAARAVFLCSAPSVGQPNAGLTGQGLRLACAEPGDQLAIFGEALRELSERATYLYEEAGRYWFSTQPTLNRLADDRAKAFLDQVHEVDAEIVRLLTEDAGTKGGFHRVFAAPDDPVTIDEAQALSLVILGPSTPHAGKGATKSAASDTIAEALMRCRASQRRFRNTLLFVAADEANLATAREVIAKAMAWDSIVKDSRLQQQMTNAQEADAKDKAKTHGDGARRAVRSAWSHIFYPVKSETAGKPFDLEHTLISSRDRAAIPAVVYEKAKGDGIALEKLGTERLWLALKPIWPEDRAHLPIAEVADWFASYVYLPRLRDRVVLENTIRDSVAKLDPEFGYADGYDEATGRYRNLVWAKNLTELPSANAFLVRAAEARAQLAAAPAKPDGLQAGVDPRPDPGPGTANGGREPTATPPTSAQQKPRRFYGSVEIDMVRPMKSFDAIFNAVVMELQRTNGAKIKLTLEIEGEAPEGFAEGEVSVVRDNAKQLKFKPESTGFEE